MTVAKHANIVSDYGQDSGTYVAIVGNLSDGYKLYGPYKSFDDAAFDRPAQVEESWIMPLLSPDSYKNIVPARQRDA